MIEHTDDLSFGTKPELFQVNKYKFRHLGFITDGRKDEFDSLIEIGLLRPYQF